MQKVKIYTIGGGVFSKFMVGMQRLLLEKNIPETIIFDINRKVIQARTGGVPQSMSEENPFDFVLDQEEENKRIFCTEGYAVYDNILIHKDLPHLKNIVKNFKFKQEILDRIDPRIDSETLGVHIRLTDMNVKHKIYENKTYDSYKKKIKDLVTPGQKILVCSDNTESIEKLIKDFPDNEIIYNDVKNRHPKEIEEGKAYSTFLRKNADKDWLWQESFLEALSLARCGSIVYRISNLNNAAVIFSNTIKEAHKI